MGLGRAAFMITAEQLLQEQISYSDHAYLDRDDFYLNNRIGVLFHKPKSWSLVSNGQFADARAGQILANGWDEDKELIFSLLGDPFCVLTKYDPTDPSLYKRFSPTIAVKATPRKDFEEKNLEQIIRKSEYSTRQILRKFKVVKRYEPYAMSGCTFYEFDCTYLFEHVNLEKPVLADLKSIKTESNGLVFDFNFTRSITCNESEDEALERFKSSILIA